MKYAPKNWQGAFFSAAAAFLLGACGLIPADTNVGTTVPDYAPLDSEVAAIAAPQSPGGDGTQVHCRVGKGSAFFQSDWYDFSEENFILPQGQQVDITLHRKKGSADSMDFRGYFDEAGQKIIFCPVVDGPPDQRIACSSIYVLDEDIKMGIRRTFDIPKALRGGEITCAYAESALKKL